MLGASVTVFGPVACDLGPSESQTTTMPTAGDHRIILRRRIFTPEPTIVPFMVSGQRRGVLQFYDRPRDSLARLARLGITVHGFQRHHAYYVTIPAGVSAEDLREIGVRAVFALQPTDKLTPPVRPPAPGVHPTVTISYASDVSRARVARALEQLGAVVTRFASPNLVLARASRKAVQALARREWVWWIEPATSEIGSLLDDARAAIRVDEVHPPPWGMSVPGLTGSGVSVAMWEFGGGPDLAHLDFGGADGGSRVSNGELITTVTEHATQVAGVLIGNGAASQSEGGAPQQWAGVAPEAVLFAYDAMAGGGVSDEVAMSFASNDTVVTNHSWGFDVDGPEDCAGVGMYGSHSQALDNVTTMIPVTSVLAAGNEALTVSSQAQCEIFVVVEGGLGQLDPAVVAEGYGTINGQATAKDALVVGSRAKDLGVTPTSSRGPTRDGRVKPDLVAIGGTLDVTLTMPSVTSTYGPNVGTSFSTPQVTGAAALLVQRYREIANDSDFAPNPALVKAVLLNTTQTLGAQGPRYSRGYGVLDIGAAVGAAENYATVVLSDGQMETVSIPAGPADACELRVMAVWTDPAAMMPAGGTLVHDVDLSVTVLDDTLLPWTLDPQQPLADAVRAENHTDNVEQVTVELPIGGAQAMLIADLPMASEQEVVVHWVYAPCEDGSGDATGDGGGDGDGGGAGCPGCSTRSSPWSMAPLWMIYMLLALRRQSGRLG